MQGYGGEFANGQAVPPDASALGRQTTQRFCERRHSLETELLSNASFEPSGVSLAGEPCMDHGVHEMDPEEENRPPTQGGDGIGGAENIFVGVRLRPLSRHEHAQGQRYSWEAHDPKTLLFTNAMMIEQTHHTQPAAYGFDRVFAPESTSETVYDEVARPMVDSAMRGMNATVFAYGQTGSGKTYTMKTIMDLAAGHIFGHIRETTRREFCIRVSAIEIYNEIVRDLLALEGAASTPSQSLRVLDDQDRGPVVEGLSEEGVSSMEHLGQILKTVQQRRQVRETRMNECSSRSHTIVRINVESRPLSTGVDNPEVSESPGPEDVGKNGAVTISTINFVDLAGSERSKETALFDHEEKLRVKEGCHINRSLLALGTVIRSLADGSGKRYVPYRDSRLTRILQPSLSGNARMAIVCTLSPASGAVETTRAALHFATCAKNVKMQPKVNEVVDNKAMIKRLQAEIMLLRRQLKEEKVARSVPSSPVPIPTPSISAVDLSELNAALKQKDQDLRATAENRDILQKRLTNLEKLILKGDPGTVKRRNSWSHDPTEPLEEEPQPSPRRPVMHSFSPVEFTHGHLRSSWHRGDMFGSLRDQPRRGACSGTKKNTHQPLLLDYWLSPPVRKRLLRMEECSGSGASSCSMDRPPPPRIDIQSEKWRLDQLESPRGIEAEEALAALQAEVRIIKHHGMEEKPKERISRLETELMRTEKHHDATGSGVAKDDMIKALKSELDRLHRAENASQLADKALESLQQKINSLAAKGGSSDVVVHNDDSQALEPVSEAITTPSRPQTSSFQDASTENQAQGSVVFEFLVPCQSSPTSPKAQETNNPPAVANDGTHASVKVTASATLNSTSRQNSGKCQPVAVTENPSNDENACPSNSHQDVLDWCKNEVMSLQSNFRASTERDLRCLQNCLKQHEDEKEKLECQKKLLLNQVLKLEFRVEESREQRLQTEKKLLAMQAAMQELMSENMQLRENLHGDRRSKPSSETSSISCSRSKLTAPTPPPCPVPAPEPNIFDRDSWADTPTVETLLPKIVKLWSELYIPLSRRSRFLMLFRGREIFYYEMEHRRLVWERSQLAECFDEEASSVDMDSGSVLSKSYGHLKLEKAAKKLEWERRWLAVQLKWMYNEEARVDLFKEWGVPLNAKERKMKLMNKLWDDETVRQPDGMMRSAGLVMQLYGPETQEEAEHMIFRPLPEDQDIPGAGFFGRLSRRLSRRSSGLHPISNGAQTTNTTTGSGSLWSGGQNRQTNANKSDS
ncbi:hypothetical protein BSKO_13773 [Bryopsis sp. KO-2023]|nr:hypothetical protein BSKO_13773 [Bryopsis sp. KO-2023]